MVARWFRPRLCWGVLFLMLPFFVQLLGFGAQMGGGLCGALLSQVPRGITYQASEFWYAMIFMILLAFQMVYGVFLVFMRLFNLPEYMHEGIYRVGAALAIILILLFILTRTVGLPHPTAIGWSIGHPVALDPLSLILVGLTLIGGLDLWGLAELSRRQLRSN